MLGIDILKLQGAGSGGGGSGTLQDASVGGTTYAQWTIGTDGFTYRRTTSGVSKKSSAWITPQIGMSDYEVRATLTSGDLPVGVFDVWLDLSTGHTWGWTNELTMKEAEMLIEIRRASDAVVIDSAVVSLFIIGIS